MRGTAASAVTAIPTTLLLILLQQYYYHYSVNGCVRTLVWHGNKQCTTDPALHKSMTPLNIPIVLSAQKSTVTSILSKGMLMLPNLKLCERMRVIVGALLLCSDLVRAWT